MNPAMRVTVGRLLLTPVFFLLFNMIAGMSVNVGGTPVADMYPANWEIGLIIAIWFVFLLSELSDLLDGWIARRYGYVTELGKLIDPFSDVLSRVTFFACFTFADSMPFAAFILILWRELAMTFMRMVLLVTGGKALAAKWSGKAKATAYFFASFWGMMVHTTLLRFFPALQLYSETVSLILYWFAAVSSLLSFLHYLLGYALQKRKPHSKEE